MKRLFIILTIASASLLNHANAADKVASAQVLASFQSVYSKATEVSWTNMGSMYKVSFFLDGKSATAFYQPDGSLVAVTRNVSSLELPASLKANLMNELDNGWISDLFVMSTTEGDIYYATLQNASNKVVLKSSNHKKWSVFQSSAAF